jgi:ribosomal protein S18 acetylase RimI-like enzyme
MFDIGVRLIAPLGASYIGSGGEGAALWYRSDRCAKTSLGRMVWTGLRSGPFRAGVRSLYRGARLFFDAARRQREEVHEPHWVLDALGVDPAHQQRGVAGALLRRVLIHADADRLPCYVITHNPANVAFYEHFGFRAVRRGAAFAGGPFVCSLRRPPQGLMGNPD